MPRVALLKPNMAGESSFPAQSKIDDNGTRNFYLNVQRMGIQVGTRVQELTGDGDSVAHLDHNRMQSGAFTMSGFMASEYAVQLSRIHNTTYNPCDIVVALGRIENAVRYVAFSGILSQISIGWALDGPFVSVKIAGRMTDTYSLAGVTDLVVETGTITS